MEKYLTKIDKDARRSDMRGHVQQFVTEYLRADGLFIARLVGKSIVIGKNLFLEIKKAFQCSKNSVREHFKKISALIDYSNLLQNPITATW